MLNSKLYSKIGRDVERYLKNQQGQQPNQAIRRQPPPTDPRREVPRTPERIEPVPTSIPNSTMSIQKDITKVIKQPTYQTDSIVINGNKISSAQVQLKIVQKKKQLSIELADAAQPKFKFEYKSDSTAIDIVAGTHLHIKSSKVQQFKNLSKQRKVQWALQNTYTVPGKENVIILVFPTELLLKGNPIKPTLFDRLLQQQFTLLKDGEYIQGQPKNQETKQETDDNDDKIQFRPLTKQDFLMVQRVKKNILQIKEQDKVSILTDAFKIKKQYDNPLVEKKLKCPILDCQKTIPQMNQYRNHVKKYHPQLSKNGIEVNEQGVFQYSQKSVDFALVMAKIYPQEVKNIIKRMKTKQSIEI